MAIATAVFKIIEMHLKFDVCFNFSHCFNFFKHKMVHLSFYHIFISQKNTGSVQFHFTLLKFNENKKCIFFKLAMSQISYKNSKYLPQERPIYWAVCSTDIHWWLYKVLWQQIKIYPLDEYLNKVMAHMHVIQCNTSKMRSFQL